MSSKFKFY